MEAVMKIGDVARQQLADLSDSRCECCGFGLRYRDKEGQRKWCKRCIDVFYRKESLKAAKAEETILKLVGRLYLDATLDTLDEELREKLLGLQAGEDVFMHGPVGVGKTHAMATLIRCYVYAGYEVERINFDDFCVSVRSTMNPGSKITEFEMIKPLKEVDKLFIDDLGLRSQLETQFTYQTLYSLLNKRQERLLPTFISSNKNIEQLGNTFDDRIASRLRTAKTIKLDGKDRRQKRVLTTQLEE